MGKVFASSRTPHPAPPCQKIIHASTPPPTRLNSSSDTLNGEIDILSPFYQEDLYLQKVYKHLIIANNAMNCACCHTKNIGLHLTRYYLY